MRDLLPRVQAPEAASEQAPAVVLDQVEEGLKLLGRQVDRCSVDGQSSFVRVKNAPFELVDNPLFVSIFHGIGKNSLKRDKNGKTFEQNVGKYLKKLWRPSRDRCNSDEILLQMPHEGQYFSK